MQNNFLVEPDYSCPCWYPLFINYEVKSIFFCVLTRRFANPTLELLESFQRNYESFRKLCILDVC